LPENIVGQRPESIWLHIGGSVKLLLWVRSPFGHWVAANCIMPPTASAVQYTTLNY